jgi:NADH-quinone oxidoreductase subunit L
MLAPLVILAVLSTVGGWVGVPHSMGGSNEFEKFLAPVFEHERPEMTAKPASHAPEGAVSRSEHETSPAESAQVPAPAPGEPSKYAHPGPAAETQPSESTELLLTGISVLAGLTGLALAYFLYIARPELPGRIATNLGNLYTTVLNKYYVDEAYQEGVVDPILEGSTEVLWRGVDVGLVDGAVNGAGSTAQAAFGALRKMQSGNIRSYAGWVALGAVALVAYMVWMGAR